MNLYLGFEVDVCICVEMFQFGDLLIEYENIYFLGSNLINLISRGFACFGIFGWTLASRFLVKIVISIVGIAILIEKVNTSFMITPLCTLIMQLQQPKTMI